MLVLQDANAKLSTTRLKNEGHQYVGDTAGNPRTDRNGSHLLDTCSENNLRIQNFAAIAPTTDRNTYVPSKGKSTITDYVAHRPSSLSRVTKVRILDPVVKATHRMLEVTVEITRARPRKRHRVPQGTPKDNDSVPEGKAPPPPPPPGPTQGTSVP